MFTAQSGGNAKEEEVTRTFLITSKAAMLMLYSMTAILFVFLAFPWLTLYKT